jgi:hypothetical protein
MLVAAHALPVMLQSKVINSVNQIGAARARDAQRKAGHVHSRYGTSSVLVVEIFELTACSGLMLRSKPL